MVTLNANGSAGRSRCVSVVAAVMLIGWSAAALAQTGVPGGTTQVRSVAASDYPGGYVVLPKVIVHTTGGTPPVARGGVATDTLIQMSNTNEAAPITVDCWWVDANSHCGGVCNPNLPGGCVICQTNADCAAQGLPGLNCVPDWSVRDFQITLTNGQPVGFLASSGLSPVPCDPTFSQSTCQAAAGGSVQPVQEDPFRGELKCLEVDVNDVPVLRSDLKIEATIITTNVPFVPPAPPPAGAATTAASYNGIGFAATDTGTGDPDDPICLGSLPTGSSGSCAATYVPCPGVLILDSFFEGATPEFGGIVNTELTLVPCSENLGDPTVQRTFDVLAQMLVYNEFEQRLSTSARVECFRSTPLLLIGNPSGGPFGIFAVGIEGTLTGQTRIRGVQGSGGPLGFGLLGVATENYRTTPTGPILATDAFNLHNTGFRADGDAVFRTQFPAPPPP